MMNYVFMCKNCSPTGLESFKKNQAPFPQMCATAIANLLQISLKDGEQRVVFHKDKDIIPYIECHWESMTTMPRRVTQSWHATVSIKRSKFHIRIVTTFLYIRQDSSSVAEGRRKSVYRRRKQHRRTTIRAARARSHPDKTKLRGDDQRRTPQGH